MTQNTNNFDIEAIISVGRVIFQKDPTDISSFRIFEGIGTAVDGDVPPEFGTNESFVAIFTGSCPILRKGQQYRVLANLSTNPKYGMQYQIQYIGEEYPLQTEDDKKRFLLCILSPGVVDALYKAFPDPFELLERGDVQALCSVKGIGLKSATKLIDRYRGARCNRRAYGQLSAYGLTKNMIDRLVDTYKSPDVAVDKIERNPYILITEVRGIGWNKADAIALAKGIGTKDPRRISAFMQEFFRAQAEEEGNTWVDLDTLVGAIRGLNERLTDDEIRSVLAQDLERGLLFFERATRRISARVYRKLEEDVCSELLRLMNGAIKPLKYIDETIEACEQSSGWEYTEEQKRAIRTMCNNPVTLVTGLAGCVDKDTEYFNGRAWKKISDYTEGDLVLQYNPDGTASLTKPLMYIKNPCEKMYHFETKYGLNQTLSDDHNVIYWTPNSVQKSCGILDIKAEQDSAESGFAGKFKTSFFYDGKGIDLTDNEIRIMCAVICDGSFYSTMEDKPDAPSYKRCRFHIKKERKKAELRRLFTESGIWWRESPSASAGYTDFYINAPRREKEFSDYWYDCNQHQLQVICDSVMFWDGHIGPTKSGGERAKFSTNIKQTADFIQFAYSACGFRASLHERDRMGKKYCTAGKLYTRKTKEYEVTVSNRTMVGLCGDTRLSHRKTRVEEVPSVDGFKYCFMVESTMLVLRRQNCIFVTGNCGKTSIMYPFTSILRKNGLSFAQCALSGKAALNLAEVTGVEGKTIHRLLGYRESGGFNFNAQNQMTHDCVIHDELSMTGGDLFLQMIQAIKTGTRLILIGDPGQLESIGLCNLISDIANSGVIPHVHLTKIFRQAQKSGIITTSLKVYNKEQIIPPEFTGEATYGELHDFTVTEAIDSRECAVAAIERFRYLHKTLNIPVDQIIVIGEKRVRGYCSSKSLNEAIQRELTFSQTKPSVTVHYMDQEEFDITYHVGDRVMVSKNCYRTIDVDSLDEIPVFNGNIGTITEISPRDGEDPGSMIVDFPQGRIELPESLWTNLQLGYAATCHKMQGSGFPFVIAICDPSAIMLSSKEMLYTQITRAKKHCYLVGTTSAIRQATATSRVRVKSTWLSQLLLVEDQKRKESEENDDA